MKQYETFIFSHYSFDSKEGLVELGYSLDDELEFTETLTFTPGIENDADIDEALFALHLIGGISYFKTCLPKTIDIQSGSLTADQAQFWNTVYENGLGEFFYRNEIDFRNLVQFPVSDASPDPESSEGTKTLVPIGGGKDSIVTIEKLKEAGEDILLLRMGAHPVIDRMVEEMDLPCITVERKLDPLLFELNAQGALNGHIPITGYLSALCTVLAPLYNCNSIAMSNEKSANEGNVAYLEKEINHQWSKSEEFEMLFQNYIHSYINPDLTYKSVLRDMTELEIVEEFAKHPQYFPLVTSCNKNWKIAGEQSTENIWCGTCPKCAFVFALLAAYLPKEKLMEIFGKNLFEDESLASLYKQLLGLEGFKPFECVGTPEETKEAFALAHARGDLDDTPIMQLYLAS